MLNKITITIIHLLLVCLINGLIGGAISGYICLHEFHIDHSVMSVYEKDAQYTRDELQENIYDNFYKERQDEESSNKKKEEIH